MENKYFKSDKFPNSLILHIVLDNGNSKKVLIDEDKHNKIKNYVWEFNETTGEVFGRPHSNYRTLQSFITEKVIKGDRKSILNFYKSKYTDFRLNNLYYHPRNSYETLDDSTSILKIITSIDNISTPVLVYLDTEDIIHVNQHTWHILDGYAVCNVKQKIIFMHREILTKNGEIMLTTDVVDHRDRNRINNRKSNIWKTTVAENNKNRTINSNNTTGVSGVTVNNKQARVSWIDPDSGERQYKYFSCVSLGKDTALAEAIKFKQELNL